MTTADLPDNLKHRILDFLGDNDDDAAVRAILSWLGFRELIPPRGLSTFRQEMERLSRDARLDLTLSGPKIVAAGRILEELLKNLLKF